MYTILITGGTGLIGQLLQKKLTKKGYEVRVLTRNPKRTNQFAWDITNRTIDDNAFTNLDYIIHLAGAGIADKQWTDKRKQEIIDSRTVSTNLLLTKVKTLQINLKGFIAASAIGYYGAITSETIFKEDDKPANDFLGRVCSLWEASSLQFQKATIPTSIFRIGVVLSKHGGALAKMNTPIAITPIASGNQYLSWIHIEDLTDMLIKPIEDKNYIGIFNAVAPDEQTSESFSKALAKQTKKVYIPIGVPKFVLKLVFGEMSIILTTGSRISSDKIKQAGYEFKFNNLTIALDDLIDLSSQL